MRKKRPSLLVLSQADLRLAVPLTQKERRRMAMNLAATEDDVATESSKQVLAGLGASSAVLPVSTRGGTEAGGLTSRRRRRASLSLAEPWLNRAVQRKGGLAGESEAALMQEAGSEESNILGIDSARRSPARTPRPRRGREVERAGLTKSRRPQWLSAGRVEGTADSGDVLGQHAQRNALAQALQYSQQPGLAKQAESRRQSVPALGLQAVHASSENH